MKKTIEINLTLTDDGPTTMDFEDVYGELDDPWYRFELSPESGASLVANKEGFEWLGRYFLKLARSSKHVHYHDHWPLDMDDVGDSHGPPELTVAFGERTGSQDE